MFVLGRVVALKPPFGHSFWHMVAAWGKGWLLQSLTFEEMLHDMELGVQVGAPGAVLLWAPFVLSKIKRGIHEEGCDCCGDWRNEK